MAEDAISVMDAAGVAEPAVVIGASMGGMIAQEMVLRYPERFRALVLGCTACGPLFRATWPKLRRSPGFWHWLRLRGEERERALVKLLYSDTTPIDRIEEDIQIRAVRQPPVRAVLSQLAGIVAWSSHRRLSQIKIPTLIVHGDQDQILPCQNGKMIAAQMPHAEFHLIPDCGHMITTDQPEISLSLVTDFLRRLRSETSVLSAAPASEAGDAGPV
jgi:pimeloyl-ACP methyl ester carboxylesterase